jgi:hypothetical protein
MVGIRSIVILKTKGCYSRNKLKTSYDYYFGREVHYQKNDHGIKGYLIL